MSKIKIPFNKCFTFPKTNIISYKINLYYALFDLF